MKMINEFVTVIFLCLLCLQAEGTPYRHLDPAFSFDYEDSTWEIKPVEAPKAGAAVDKAMAEKTLVNAQRRQADEKYHARFSVVLDQAKRFEKPGKSLLETYREHAVEFMNGQRFQIKTVTDHKLPGVGHPAFEIIGEQRDFGLKFRQVVFLDGDSAVLITGATRKEKFEEQGKELEKMFSSFMWGKK